MHKTIAATSSELRLSKLKGGRTVDQESSFIFELAGTVLTFVRATVLLLSAAGIYALMSFTVAQRRREIGIRTALGGSRQSVMTTTFSRAARQSGLGVRVGAIITTVLDRVTEPVAVAQTVFLVPLVAVMVVVGLGAAFAPTPRGLAVQPVEALGRIAECFQHAHA